MGNTANPNSKFLIWIPSFLIQIPSCSKLFKDIQSLNLELAQFQVSGACSDTMQSHKSMGILSLNKNFLWYCKTMQEFLLESMICIESGFGILILRSVGAYQLSLPCQVPYSHWHLDIFQQQAIQINYPLLTVLALDDRLVINNWVPMFGHVQITYGPIIGGSCYPLCSISPLPIPELFFSYTFQWNELIKDVQAWAVLDEGESLSWVLKVQGNRFQKYPY